MWRSWTSCLVVDLAKFVLAEGKDRPSEANDEIIDVYEVLRVTSTLNRNKMITKELRMLVE